MKGNPIGFMKKRHHWANTYTQMKARVKNGEVKMIPFSPPPYAIALVLIWYCFDVMLTLVTNVTKVKS